MVIQSAFMYGSLTVVLIAIIHDNVSLIAVAFGCLVFVVLRLRRNVVLLYTAFKLSHYLCHLRPFSEG